MASKTRTKIRYVDINASKDSLVSKLIGEKTLTIFRTLNFFEIY